jgi:hypothetical protein
MARSSLAPPFFRIVMFRPGLKPKSRPGQAKIGRAKPGQNDGLERLLARPEVSPGQGQAVRPRLFGEYFWFVLDGSTVQVVKYFGSRYKCDSENDCDSDITKISD